LDLKHRKGQIMPTLDFKGKQLVYSHHLSVPFKTLEIDKAKSLPEKGKEPSFDDNLIIHGDNLEALKALLPTYAGKIKCIYIDPPYNTGNEGWVYNDNVNSPLMKEWLKKNGPVDREDLERHDKWLCMMWPRLKLLRELLAEDGVIFISIDDNELHRLRILMDEVFGEEHLVGVFTWRRRINPDSRNQSGVSEDHEYVVAYNRDSSKFAGAPKDLTKYQNPDNDPRGPWMSMDMTGLANKEQRPNLHYSITDPKTRHKYDPPPQRGWAYSKERMQQMIENGEVLFPKNGNGKGRPRQKKFLKDLQSQTMGFSTWLNQGFTNTDGTRSMMEIFQKKIFDFPKPIKLIQTLIGQVLYEDDIVLDSFAGSGTTAHAVLDMNATDSTNRRFILIECEDYADNITAERIRRIIKGVSNAKDENLKRGLGGSFTFCSLGAEINVESLLKGDKLPAYESLAEYVFYTATGKTLTQISKPKSDYFIGETDLYRVHLVYKPDRSFLMGNESALNFDLCKNIKNTSKGKKSLVFATQKFMSQKELTSDYNIEFCQLPYALHKIMGN